MTEDPKRIAGKVLHRVKVTNRDGTEECHGFYSKRAADDFRKGKIFEVEVDTAVYLNPEEKGKTT